MKNKKRHSPKVKNSGLLRLTNETHNIEKLLMDNLIGLDDTFKFDSSKNSRMCKGHAGNTLYPYDIYAMSKALKLTTQEFMDKYCETYISLPASLVPLVRFKTVGTENKCPMLENGQCKVCENKPLICSTYPLSVFVAAKEDGTALSGYLLNKSATSPVGKTYTVREWLSRNDVDEKDEFTSDFVTTYEIVKEILSPEELTEIPRPLLKPLTDTIFKFLYSGYDTSIDFSTQFLANKQELLELCIQIIEEKIKNEEEV